jgi:hypothetical protein
MWNNKTDPFNSLESGELKPKNLALYPRPERRGFTAIWVRIRASRHSEVKILHHFFNTKEFSMPTFSRIFTSLVLLMGAQMAMAQSTDAATATAVTAVRQFSTNPTYCTQFLAGNDAGADGLDAAYSSALEEILYLSDNVEHGLIFLRTACTERLAAANYGGVVGFYMHPVHCQTLTGTGPTSPNLMQKLIAKASYRKLYASALASATDSIGGESSKAVSELEQLCSVRAASLPSGATEL